MLSEIIKRALVYSVTDIGQLTAQDKRDLQRAVKRGWLSKGIGGPFPKLKVVYARLGYDFQGERERAYREIMLCIRAGTSTIQPPPEA